jgi:glycosyltransferase involved in cell wall biosynthesis
MRILFVSNMFPPFGRGGYEQWCEEVAVSLNSRGHAIAILTSRPGGATNGVDTARPFPVYRLLHTQVEGGLAETTLRLLREPHRHEDENLAQTRRVLDEFRPDVAMIWGMWNIDRSVPQQIEERLGSNVTYYFCDYWPSLPSAYIQRLQEPARRPKMQQFKSLVSRYFMPRLAESPAVPLRLEHPICVSRAVRDILVARGVEVAHAKIVYGGTTVEEYAALPPRQEASRGRDGAPLRLLYMGRLERIKGVHTVVRAMRSVDVPTTLDILGAGDPDYQLELQAMVREYALEERVEFLGAAQRTEVPQVLSAHDVLLFSSEWEEPFARSILEAMAAGLVVIGTTTGGTGEILVEGETGLTFRPGDAEQLAAQICRLGHDGALRRTFSETGSRLIRQYYTLGRMVDELEAELYATANKPVSLSL